MFLIRRSQYYFRINRSGAQRLHNHDRAGLRFSLVSGPWSLVPIYVLGAIEALLLTRLLLHLLAARPDNPVIAALFTISAVLIQPLSFLDAGQPHFGAMLDFSALVASLFGCVILGAWVILHRKASFSER